MLKNLLIYRLLLVNLAGLYGLFFAYQQGWVEAIYNADASYITGVITFLFVLVTASAFIQAGKVGKYINQVKVGIPWAYTALDSIKRLHKLAHIDRAAGWMYTLGLIGTVIGFMIAFNDIDMSLIGDASGVQTLAAQLISGVGTSLVTTLVGAIFGLWTEVNYKMIVTAARVISEEEA